MSKYPYLHTISQRSGIPADKLQEIYEMEHKFYHEIMNEPSFDARQKLYEYVYMRIHEIYCSPLKTYFQDRIPIKTKIARQFENELKNKSLLDVGCGDGTFLYALSASKLKTKELYGLDIKAPSFPDDEFGSRINCFQRNIIRYEIDQKFDNLMLDNVYEHIAPQDKTDFLNSITKSLKPGGKLIMIIPHKFFGPTDFTTIIEGTFRGKIPAQCVHLNETTFTEVMADLQAYGYGNFTTTIPFIAFSFLRNIFPAFRMPASIFARLENSKFWMSLFRSTLFKGKCLFRMEVVIIATLNNRK
ncbi:MAG: class I SAM-dependent methyltransferase [Saprospiraceae bacterium]